MGETMIGSQPAVIRVQDLMGRQVRDGDGNVIGRVYDLETGHVRDGLCVTALLLGKGAWITRFGWSERERGTRIDWRDIVSLAPHITVRSKGRG